MTRERVVLRVCVQTLEQAPAQGPHLADEPPGLGARQIVHEVRARDAARGDSRHARVQRGIDGCREHRRIHAVVTQARGQWLDDLEVARLARREDDAWVALGDRRRPSGVTEELPERLPFLATPERAKEGRQCGRRRDPRRRVHRNRAVLGEGPHEALRDRGAGHEHDTLRLDVVHDPLERREELEQLESQEDALGDGEQVGQPHSANQERRFRPAPRPPRGDEPGAEVRQGLGLGLERFLVVEAEAHAGRQRRAIEKLPARQERHLVGGRQPRERRGDGAAVPPDVRAIERADPGSAELAQAARRLRHD